MKKTLLTWLLILTSLTTFAADKPISGLTIYNGAPGTNDLVPFVNRSDVTQSTNGSTRSMTWSNVNWSLRTSYPAMTLTNIGLTGSNVNVTNIIGYNGSTFYGSGAVVDNWVFYGNNTFTGDTNRFASTVLLTNMNNTVSGNGAGLTNISPSANLIYPRLIGWSSIYTNYSSYTNSYNEGRPATNAGDFGTYAMPVAQISCSRLLSTNSRVAVSMSYGFTNINFAHVITFYAGAATNFIGAVNTSGANNSPYCFFSTQEMLAVMDNAGSFNSQMLPRALISGAFATTNLVCRATNVVDTSDNWNLYVGFQGPNTYAQGSMSNFVWGPITVYELYRP